MNISVIVPLLNEAESLPELSAWIKRVMDQNNFTYEVLMIDDGSTDDSWNASKVFDSVATMVNLQRSTRRLKPVRVMWLSQWMPTCKIPQTRFLNCIE